MTLRLLLSNVLYTGAVNHKGTIYPGEHERIVEQQIWERVNAQLAVRSAHQRGRRRSNQEAALKGILYCAGCGSALSLSSTRRHGRRYSYYLCPRSGQRANHACSQSPVAVVDLEQSIIKKLEPVLGTNLSWTEARKALRSIHYDSTLQKVVIDLKAGTQMKYDLNPPGRAESGEHQEHSHPARAPRVSRLLALAIKFQQMLLAGSIRNYRDIAAAGHISRARMSQVMRLTELAPSIQEEILFLPRTVRGADRITEKALRQVARLLDWDEQCRRFEALKHVSNS